MGPKSKYVRLKLLLAHGNLSKIAQNEKKFMLQGIFEDRLPEAERMGQKMHRKVLRTERGREAWLQKVLRKLKKRQNSP